MIDVRFITPAFPNSPRVATASQTNSLNRLHFSCKRSPPASRRPFRATGIAAGHMAKGLAKIASWGGYLPMAIKEPQGAETALAITAGTMGKPASMLPMDVVSVLSLFLLVTMAYFSLRESRLADTDTHKSRVPSILLATFASAYLIFGWGFLG